MQEKREKVGKYPTMDSNVMHKFPTVNVEAINCRVKIGDEFSFAKNVIIVTPREDCEESGQNREKCEREEASQNHSYEKRVSEGSFHYVKNWLLAYSTTTTAKAFLAAVTVAIASLIAVTALVVSWKRADDNTPAFEIPGEYVKRYVWKDGPRKCAYARLDKPAALVIIEQTSGTFCYNFSECQQSVKNSQQLHQNLPYYCDIRFGFVVGGDCRIYEGRNFSQRENVPGDPYFNRSVEVAFIGNYSRDEPNECQVKNLLTFLKDSVLNGFLDRNYKIVGAFQVYKHEPHIPGKNLMDQITQWDMWTNDTTII